MDRPEFDHHRLDEVLQARLRLAIVAALAANDGQDFPSLRTLVGATDGNMSTHLKKLEEAEYLRVEKAFEGRKPVTRYWLSKAGRKALARYIATLEDFINGGKT
jgi:DNA-binding MarR family transcriptional regulator